MAATEPFTTSTFFSGARLFEDACSLRNAWFDVLEHRGLKIGVLLCTELMFNEWARTIAGRVLSDCSAVPAAHRAMGHRRCHGSHCFRLLRPQLQSRIPVNDPNSNWRTRFVYRQPRVAGRNIALDALVTIDVDVTRVAEAQSDTPTC
jgi:predicted amidohydrolase